MGSMLLPFGNKKKEPMHWDLYRKTWANPKIWNAPSPPPQTQTVYQYQAAPVVKPTAKEQVRKSRTKEPRPTGTILVDEEAY